MNTFTKIWNIFLGVLFVCFVLGFPNKLNADTKEQIYESAGNAYRKGDFAKAIQNYELIISDLKFISPELLLNLGNAYYRQQDYPNAMLNYERALKNRPGYGLAEYNIKLLKLKLKDKIEPIPDFFITRWLQNIRNFPGMNVWLLFFFLFLFSCSFGAIIYLKSSQVSTRKTGFYSSLISLPFATVCFLMAYSLHSEMKNTNSGIIFSKNVSVKNSPVNNAIGLFIIHEGTKVKIQDRLGSWIKISTEDGNDGWIQDIDLVVI